VKRLAKLEDVDKTLAAKPDLREQAMALSEVLLVSARYDGAAYRKWVASEHERRQLDSLVATSSSSL
jgi:hypothetical protein